MASYFSLARPYAKAAFAFGQEHKSSAEWATALDNLAMIVEVPEMAQLLRNPTVSIEQKTDFVSECAGNVSEPVKNFIKTLADNHRLLLLPAIRDLYNEYKSEAERRMDVHITSALPLDEKQRERFTQALSKRLDRDVNLICSTDSNLMGGAVIRAGDEVIDGSARGKLEQLADSLMNG